MMNLKRIAFESSDQDRRDSYSRLKARFADRFVGFPGPQVADVADDFTVEEEKGFRDILAKRDNLDAWESSKFRNLTLAQVNNEITARQTEINVATNLAQAKTAMLNLLQDDAKAWRIVLWLMKREMNELE
jgi:hypothetical protein